MLNMSPSSTLHSQSSVLFEPYRSIGIVTDGLKCIYTPLGQTNFITTSVGRAFQVYSVDKLTPSFICEPLQQPIAALEASRGHVCIACENENVIYVYHKVKRVGTLKEPLEQTQNGEQIARPRGTIRQLLLVGDILFSIDTHGRVLLWDIKAMEFIEELEFPDNFQAVYMFHPMTYLNKLLFAGNDGQLQLWNIRRKVCIYKFDSLQKVSFCDVSSSSPSVSCIEQSPVVDVVAIGYDNGVIIIHNLQLDKTLMRLRQKEGRVFSLSFRKDTCTIPMLASTTTNGALHLWNLEERKLHTTIGKAHNGEITTAVFFPNEPFLLTAGTDNAMKVWIFDLEDNLQCRELKSRQGHYAPPTFIRYYRSAAHNVKSLGYDSGTDGTICQMISAGKDHTMRYFHTTKEQQNCEFSQGKGVLKKAVRQDMDVEQLKLPPIQQFMAVETRERDWSNVISCHENSPAAYLWNFESKALAKSCFLCPEKETANMLDGGSTLSPKVVQVTSFDAAGGRKNRSDFVCKDLRNAPKALSVAMSSCGNYGLVGMSNGIVYKYNVQSCELRGTYPKEAMPQHTLLKNLTIVNVNDQVNTSVSQAYSIQHKHKGSIMSIRVDALNKTVATAGTDGYVKFWDFRTAMFCTELNFHSPIVHMELHYDSFLLAIATEDCKIRIVDMTHQTIVRQLDGHVGKITDLCFNSTSHWLVSASEDDTVRVWDLSSGKCIDCMQFENAVKSLCFSLNNEFLATVHENQRGIYLWSNKTFFQDVILGKECNVHHFMDLPQSVSEENESFRVLNTEENVSLNNTKKEQQEEQNEQNEEDEEILAKHNEKSVTLGKENITVWTTLFCLDAIKERNKPIEPPKKPENAPFFLPSLPSEGLSQVTAKSLTEEMKVKDKEHEEENEENPTKKKKHVSKMLVRTDGESSTKCHLAVLLLERQPPKKKNQRQEERLESSVTDFGSCPIIQYLQSLSASAVDVEISSLCSGVLDTEGFHILQRFVDFIEEGLLSCQMFLLFQACLNRVLRLYSDILVNEKKFLNRLKSLHQLQRNVWDPLEGLIQNNLCLIRYFSKLQC